MFVSRLVSLTSWSVLSSFSTRVAPVFRAPVFRATCTTKITGKGLVKLGGTKNPISDLDIFLGRWVQQTIHQIDKTERTVDLKTPIRLEGHQYKPYLSYARNNGVWNVEMGFVGKSMDIFYKFKLGRPFIFIYPDNTVSRIIVYQNDDQMKWSFQPLNFDINVPLREQDVVHQLMKVENDQLIVKTEYPNKTVVMKTYTRDDSGDL